MKQGGSFTASVAHLIARAARGEGKTGEGKVSTEVIAPILGLPGAPIFSETGVEAIGTRNAALSLQSDLHLLKTPDIVIRVEFPAPARAAIHVKQHPRRRGKLFHRSSTLNETTFSV